MICFEGDIENSERLGFLTSKNLDGLEPGFNPGPKGLGLVRGGAPQVDQALSVREGFRECGALRKPTQQRQLGKPEPLLDNPIPGRLPEMVQDHAGPQGAAPFGKFIQRPDGSPQGIQLRATGT
ncbi:hypothetical protein [Mesoterricola sediminis]|uniref:hypothetical protein n=1 Tax=Mesoterricola sediminis TaxID=2927980 RepID=UPI00292D99BD|nr:hypothetical protein [Mesoterricola sediminis]